jgi:glycosyltransferase involved in cell wall biosynthesis
LRVTFLTNMPSPYTLDLFAAMEKDGRIAPHVLYMEMTQPETHWGHVRLPHSAELLFGGGANLGGGRVQWNPRVIGAIRRSRPDLVVVSGYSSLTNQIAMRWLRWKRMPWIFWGEIPGIRKLSRWAQRLRTFSQAPALRWADAIAAIGSQAVDEYRRRARQGCEVVNLPYYTDLRPFFDVPRAASNESVEILYCGQLIERKGLRTLIDAFVNVADQFPQSKLLLVGEGPLRQSLIERVPSRFRARVLFAGFQPIDRLPQFFSTADIFVLPSLHDGWGVVVNQALGAGLPIVCSSAVGAAADLVSPGWNGFVVPPADVSALAGAIRSLVSDQQRRVTFGENSRAAAHNWVPSKGVDRWVNLATGILSRRSVRVLAASSR